MAAVNFVNFLKSRLIFNLFYCFWMYVNKLFTYFAYPNLRSKRCFYVKSSTYCFHKKTKILVDFQICIRVSLKKNDQLFNLMFLFLYFHHSSGPNSKCDKQKWGVLFFTHIKLVLPVLALCVWLHASNG